MPPKVLVPIANGTEEIEAVTIIDILRRAGAEVTVASVDDLKIVAARGVNIEADRLLRDCLEENWDLIALPGGIPGAERFRDSPDLIGLLQRQQQAGRISAAICAAPAVVFQHHGLLQGLRATAHPGFTQNLDDRSSVEDRVVVDGNVVTSRGVGTALEFALKLVEMLFDRSKAEEIAEAIVFRQIAP